MWKNIFVLLIIALIFSSCMTQHLVRPAQYEKKKVPYQTEEEKKVTVEPIVNGDNLVIAFTRLAGAKEYILDRIIESIKIGFEEEARKSSRNRIKYISRAELIRNLSRQQLINLGPVVEKNLRNIYHVNIVCTGTVLSDKNNNKKLSVEILDYRNGKVISEVFTNTDWDNVGSDVAKAFFGTRVTTKKVKVTKFKTENGKKIKDAVYESEIDWGSTLLLFGTIAILVSVSGD